MTYSRGLDAATILTPYAKTIAERGFAAAGRYLKSLTSEEIAALHEAGVAVWLIFETTATRALDGTAAGQVDGAKARSHAEALAAPAGTAIYATVDVDVSASSDADRDQVRDLAEVAGYFDAFSAGLGPYRMGGYADGAVLKEDNAHLVFPWLAGAMGWSGSRDYEPGGAWAIKQGPEIPAQTAKAWAGIDWPALPFPYDPNVIAADDFGAWRPVAAMSPEAITAPIAAPAPPILRRGDIKTDVGVLQKQLSSLGYYQGRVDNDFGPKTERAVRLLQRAGGLVEDGIVGRQTWAFLAFVQQAPRAA